MQTQIRCHFIDPDQGPHNVASDLGLHCLLTGFTIKIEYITVEEFTSIQWIIVLITQCSILEFPLFSVLSMCVITNQGSFSTE